MPFKYSHNVANVPQAFLGLPRSAPLECHLPTWRDLQPSPECSNSSCHAHNWPFAQIGSNRWGQDLGYMVGVAVIRTHSRITRVVAMAVWGRALSCCNDTPVDNFPRRSLFTRSRSSNNPDPYRSAFTVLPSGIHLISNMPSASKNTIAILFRSEREIRGIEGWTRSNWPPLLGLFFGQWITVPKPLLIARYDAQQKIIPLFMEALQEAVASVHSGLLHFRR